MRQALERIDALYAGYADEDDAGVERGKHQLGGMDAVFGTPETIDALCRDIVAHYEQMRAELHTGKAMIVAYSRPIAIKIHRRILELRPEWEDGVGVVMTMGNKDPEGWFDICGGQTHKKDMERRFKSDDDTLKIAIVVDMWLTDFDEVVSCPLNRYAPRCPLSQRLPASQSPLLGMGSNHSGTVMRRCLRASSLTTE